MTEYVERKVRTHLDEGEQLMVLADTSAVVAEMMVPEKNWRCSERISRPDSAGQFPDAMLKAKWTICSISAPVDGRQVTVRAYLSNTDGVLKPELTGIANLLRSAPHHRGHDSTHRIVGSNRGFGAFDPEGRSGYHEGKIFAKSLYFH